MSRKLIIKRRSKVPVEKRIEKHYNGNDGIDGAVAITNDDTHMYDQPVMWVH